MALMHLRLSSDQKVEIESATAHVGQDLDRRGGDAFAVDGRVLLRFLVFLEDAGEEAGVAVADLPVLAHLPESLDEHVDRVVDAVGDCGTVDKQNAGCDPAGERKGWAELGQESVFPDALTQSYEALNCTQTPLACAEGRCKYWGAMCRIGC